MTAINANFLTADQTQLDAFKLAWSGVNGITPFNLMNLDLTSIRTALANNTVTYPTPRTTTQVVQRDPVSGGTVTLNGSGFITTGPNIAGVGTTVTSIAFADSLGRNLLTLNGSISMASASTTYGISSLKIGDIARGGEIVLTGNNLGFTQTDIFANGTQNPPTGSHMTLTGSLSSIVTKQRADVGGVTTEYQTTLTGALTLSGAGDLNSMTGNSTITTMPNLGTGSLISGVTINRITYTDATATTVASTTPLLSLSGLSMDTATLNRLVGAARGAWRDPTFGAVAGAPGDGMHEVFTGTDMPTASRMKRLDDGKIMLAGVFEQQTPQLDSFGNIIGITTTAATLRVARFNANGTVDTTYGSNGQSSLVLTPPDANHQFILSGINPATGNLLITQASSTLGGNINQVTTTRINANGTTTPLTTLPGLPIPLSSVVGVDLREQGNSNIVQALLANDSPGNQTLYMVRKLANGGMDTAFGTGGLATNALGTASFDSVFTEGYSNGTNALVVLGDSGATSGTPGFTLMRYTNTGLDTSFGNGGSINFTAPLGTPPLTGFDAQTLADGRILVVGTLNGNNISAPQVVLFRYNANGTPDNTFNPNSISGFQHILGVSVGDPGNYIAPTFHFEPDGKLLVASSGQAPYDPNNPMAWTLYSNLSVARFNADGTPDTSFGNGSGVVNTTVNGVLLVGQWPSYGFQSLPYFQGAMASQPDGSVVIDANSMNNGSVIQIAANGNIISQSLNAVGGMSANYVVDPGTGAIVIANTWSNGPGFDYMTGAPLPGTTWNTQLSRLTPPPLIGDVLSQTVMAGNDTISLNVDKSVTLNGYAGNDTLTTGGGNDTLDGGIGNDTLTGGLGADRFIFSTPLNATTNVDTITDFNAVEGDIIELSGAPFSEIAFDPTGALPAAALSTTGAATSVDTRIIYNSTTGALSYDADGTGATAAVQFATLSNLPTLTFANFLGQPTSNITSIVSLTPSQLEGNTGVTPFVFQVTRDNGSVAGNIKWSVSGSGANAANAADFVVGADQTALPSGTLSFDAGQTVALLTVSVQGDFALENDEGFSVTLSNGTNIHAAAPQASASATILNEDTAWGAALAELDAMKQAMNANNITYTTRTATKAVITIGPTAKPLGFATMNGSGFLLPGASNPQDSLLGVGSAVTSISYADAQGRNLLSMSGNFNITSSSSTLGFNRIQLGDAALNGMLVLTGSNLSVSNAQAGTGTSATSAQTLSGKLTGIDLTARNGTNGYQLALSGNLAPTGSFLRDFMGNNVSGNLSSLGSGSLITAVTLNRLTYPDATTTTPSSTTSSFNLSGVNLDSLALNRLVNAAQGNWQDPTFGATAGAFNDGWVNVLTGTSMPRFGTLQRLDTGKFLLAETFGNNYVPGGPPVTRTGRIARFNADGTVDTTYGTNGQVSITATVDATHGFMGSSTKQINPSTGNLLYIQVTGSAGVSTTTYSTTRINATGGTSTALPSFTLPIDIRAPINTNLRELNDGRTVYAVQAFDDQQMTTQTLYLVRQLSTGALDTTFNATGAKPGVATFSLNSLSTGITDIVFTRDYGLGTYSGDVLVVLGNSGATGGTPGFTLMRYTGAGVLDTSFNTTGIQSFSASGTPPPGTAIDAQTLADGRVLVVTTSQGDGTSLPPMVTLFRYTAAGIPDPSFGTNGMLHVNMGDLGNTIAPTFHFDPDGKLLVAASGYAFDPITYMPAGSSLSVARFNADGTPDTSFGTNGLVNTTVNAPGLSVGQYSQSTQGSPSLDGTYTNTTTLTDGYTHTETDTVTGLNVTGHHTFTNGTQSGSFDWQGTISPANGMITGSGTINNMGTRAIVGFSGGIQVSPDGTAQIFWGGIDTTFGGIGWTTQSTTLHSFGASFGGALASQPDGSVVIDANTPGHGTVIRVAANGTTSVSQGVGAFAGDYVVDPTTGAIVLASIDSTAFLPLSGTVNTRLTRLAPPTPIDTVLSQTVLAGDNTITWNDTQHVTLNGYGGNDLLTTGSFNDILDGGLGNDNLDGGLGNDILTGGDGLDRFVFSTALNAATNVDTITDFNASLDKIFLAPNPHDPFAGISFNADGSLPASAFESNTTGVATSADTRIIYNTTTGALSDDADGTGATAAVQFATLATPVIDVNGITTGYTHPALTAANFMTAAVSLTSLSSGVSEGNTGSTPFIFKVVRSGTGSTAAASLAWTLSGTGSPDSATVGGPNSDFASTQASTGTVSFIAGQTSAQVTILVAGDTAIETDETFGLTLSATANNAAQTAYATIHNDDTRPMAFVTASATTVREGGNVVFTVGRSGNTALSSTVQWAITGEGNGAAGVNSTDFVGAGQTALPSGSVSFSAGQTTAQLVTVNVFNDLIAEYGEGFRFALSSSNSNPALDADVSTTAGAASVRIQDTSVPDFAISPATVALKEGNTASAPSTPFVYTVTRSGDLTKTASVGWDVSGIGTNAANAADFVGSSLPSGTVNFAANVSSATLTVAVQGDTTAEASESFNVVLRPSASATISTDRAQGIIVNDDGVVPDDTRAAARELIASASDFVGTLDTQDYYHFHLGATQDIHLSLTGLSGNADIVLQDSTGSLTLPGATISSSTWGGNHDEAIDASNLAAGDYYVRVYQGSGDANYNLNLTATAPLRGTLSFASSTIATLEGNSGTTDAVFTVNRAGGSGAATVDWTLNSTMPSLDGADFGGGTFPSGTLTFADGVNSATITVSIAGDTLVETNENYSIALSNAGNAVLDLSHATASGTIRNDDISQAALPMVSIQATDANKLENFGGAATDFVFTVSRSGDLSNSSSVNWGVSGLTADASDFVGNALPTGTVSFLANEAEKFVTVQVQGDTKFEADETFAVNLSAPTGAKLNPNGIVANGIIRNDDTPSTFAIAATDAYKYEGNSGTTAFTFTVNRTGDTSAAADATVHWAVANLTSSATDFDGGTLPTGDLTFATGVASQIVTILVAGDTNIEQDERFQIQLSNAAGGVIDPVSGAAQGVIRNDDQQNVFSIAAVDAIKMEGNSGTTDFTFNLTSSSGSGTVKWQVGALSPDLIGDDFIGGSMPSGTVDFTNGIITYDQAADGTTRASTNFTPGSSATPLTIQVAGDYMAENDKQFYVALNTPVSGLLSTIRQATGIIVDDDSYANLTSTSSVVSVSAVDSTKLEGDSGTTNFVFNVLRSGDLTQTVAVDWHVAGLSSGIAATDFVVGAGQTALPLTGLPSAAITFGAGQSSIAVTVGVQGDTLQELNESFALVIEPALVNGANVIISNTSGSARTVILNDDTPPEVSISAYVDGSSYNQADKLEGNSGATDFVFRVARTGGTTLSAASTVNWAVASNFGTASANDFVGAPANATTWRPSGSVNFAAGETEKFVTVQVQGDRTVEADEIFRVNLLPTSTNAVFAATGRTAFGQIRTDDLSSNTISRVSIEATDADKLEGDPTGTTPYVFTLRRSGNLISNNVAATWAVTGTGNNAAVAADFGTALPSGVTTFAAGSDTATVTINVVADNLVEADKSFAVNIKSVSNGEMITASSVAQGVIRNDDLMSNVSVERVDAQGNVLSDLSVTERTSTTNTPTVYRISRAAGTTTGTLGWSVNLAGQSASSADFVGGATALSGAVSFNSSTPTIPADPTRQYALVTVNILADSIAESNETFAFQLNATPGVSFDPNGQSQLAMRIIDDDDDYGSSTTKFGSLTLGNGITGSIIPAGDQDWFKITLAANTRYEFAIGSPDFAPVLRLMNANGNQLVDNATGANGMTILSYTTGTTAGDYFISAQADNGGIGNYGIQANVAGKDDYASSSATTGMLALTGARSMGRIETSGDADWFKTTLVGGTVYQFSAQATDGLSGGHLRLLDAAGNSLLDATGNPVGDSIVNNGSIFEYRATTAVTAYLAVDGGTGGTGLYAVAVQAIAATDATAVPTIDIVATADSSQLEGNSGTTNFVFQVNRSGNTQFASTVGWSVAAPGTSGYATLTGTASDFIGATSGTVNFAIGATSATITIGVRGDTLAESDESFTVNLSTAPTGNPATTPVNAILGAASATGLIRNDDALPEVSIRALTASALEGTSATGLTPFVFEVTRSGITTAASSVTWTRGSYDPNVTAADFSGVSSGVVNFAAGSTSQLVTINVAQNNIEEGDESFYVRLATPVGAVLGANEATSTILNDDLSNHLAVQAVDAIMNEGNSGFTPFTFTVLRSGDLSGSNVAVDWKVTGTGANAAVATDFQGNLLPGGTITFAANEPSRAITINVAGNFDFAANKDFAVTLSNARNAVLDVTQATGTILNDDLPVISISSVTASAAEGAQGTTSNRVFTLTRSSALGGALTVNWGVALTPNIQPDATDFVNGTHFVSDVTPGTATFAAGATSTTVTVGVAGDSTVEADETMLVNVMAGNNYVVSGTAGIAGSIIVNDDAGTPASFDDNDIAHAVNIGTLLSATPRTLSNGVGATDTQDYYAFTVSATSSLDLKLDGLAPANAVSGLAAANADLQLLDANGNIIGGSYASGNAADNINLSSLAAGDYFARIYQYSGDTNYTLTVKATALTETANNGATASGARNIGTLTDTAQVFNDSVASNDSDYYRFTTTGESDFRLSLAGLTDNADVYLLNSDGQTVMESSTNIGTAAESISKNNLAAGSYYVWVSPMVAAVGDSTPYTLTLSAETTAEDERSGNTISSVASVTAVALNATTGVAPTITGSVGSTDRNDYYRIDTLTQVMGVRNFSLALTGMKADADVQLLNTNGVVVGESHHTGKADETFSINNMAAATYYVRVYQQSGNTNYTLNMTAAPLVLPVDNDGTAALAATATNNALSNVLGTLTSTPVVRQDTLGFAAKPYTGEAGDNGIDSNDWYKFTLGTASSIEVSLSDLSASADVFVYKTGGATSDTLIGGTGADQLDGDVGNDNLTGGAGADRFIFSTTLNATTNVDTITDYNATEGDVIELMGTPFAGITFANGLLPGNALETNTTGVASSASTRIIYNSATGALYYDADGSSTAKAAVQFATLSTPPVGSLVFGNSVDNTQAFGQLVVPTSATTPQSNNAGTASEFFTTNSSLTAGTYTVQVKSADGIGTGYKLAVRTLTPGDTGYDTLGAATTDNITSFNSAGAAIYGGNAITTAAPLTGFVGASDGNDYYRFTTAATRNFQLDMKNISANANADVQLLNSSGTVIAGSYAAGSASGNTSDSISVINLAAGTYYARVYQVSGDANYSLSISATTASLPVDADGTVAKAAAITLTNGVWKSTAGQSIGFAALPVTGSDVDGIDKYDYYSLNLASSSFIQATLSGLTANADIEVFYAGKAAGTTADILIGTDGIVDQLDGGLGNDTLTGGTGADSFIFSTALNATTNVDTITDFNVAEDKIVLSGTPFAGINFNADGSLPASALSTAGVVADANTRIVYDETTGALSYDADGTGTIAAVQFATLSNKPAASTLTSASFNSIGTLVLPEQGQSQAVLPAVDSFTSSTALMAGTYYVRVSSRDGASTGTNYSASLTTFTDDFAATTATAGFIEVATNNVSNDTLTGGSGIDRLNGGLGNDTLTGGTGADRFIFSTVPNASTNIDTIIDFNAVQGDVIELSSTIFAGITFNADGSLPASALSTTGAATSASTRIIYDATTGALSYDADGTGTAKTAVQFATLSNLPGAGTLAAALRKSVPQTTGTINAIGDMDWFAVTLTAGKTYTIRQYNAPAAGTAAAQTLADSYIRGIYDSTGVLLENTSNDDCGALVPAVAYMDASDSQVVFKAAADGTYYIAAGAYGSNTGSYTVSVEERTNLAPVVSNAPVNQTAMEDHAFSYRMPWNAFTDPEGQAMTYAATLGDGTALPTWLTFDAASQMFFGTPTANSPDLNIRVTATDPGIDGDPNAAADNLSTSLSFMLNTPASNDDFRADFRTTGRIVVGDSERSSVRGNIETAYDQDWFRVSLTSGTKYVIDLRRTDGAGRLSDPYFRGVLYSFDPATGATTLIANTTNDDANGSPNSQVKYTATQTGDYFVSAGGFGKQTGAYVMSVVAEVPLINTAPTHTPGSAGIADQTAYEGQAWRFTIPSTIFTDADPGQNGQLTYSAELSNGSDLPSWLRFDATTRTFTGTPVANSNDLSILLTARDGGGLAVSDTFALNTPAASQTNVAGSGRNNWTIMIYMAADNNLDPYALKDLNEMESVTLPSGVKVVFMLDRLGANNSYRGVVATDANLTTNASLALASNKLATEVNSGDPSTLRDFIDWSASNYTADHYGLVVWDHGGGLSGTSWDTNTGVAGQVTNLSVADTTYAIQSSVLGTHGLDMVGFDTCLQGMVEQAYDLRNVTQYVVASQNLEPGDGWDYASWLQTIAANSDSTAQQVATAAVSTYGSFYNNQQTMSAVNTGLNTPLTANDGLIGLRDAINNFVNAAAADPTQLTALQNARNGVTNYNNSNYLDLGAYMANAATATTGSVIATTGATIAVRAAEVSTALAAAVVATTQVGGAGSAGLDDSGLSIFLPSITPGAGYTASQFQFVNDSNWNSYINTIAA